MKALPSVVNISCRVDVVSTVSNVRVCVWPEVVRVGGALAGCTGPTAYSTSFASYGIIMVRN